MSDNSIDAIEVREATMDAAALLLAITRGDMEGINIIVNNSNQYHLLSGVIAVAMSGMNSLTEGNPEPFMMSLVSYLHSLTDEDWNSIAGNSVFIKNV